MFPEDSQTPAGQPPLDGSSLSKLRDFEKVRERILLRIEPRHVAQLLIAALMLATAAFVGGYAAGARGYRPAWLGEVLTGPAAMGAAEVGAQLPVAAPSDLQPLDAIVHGFSMDAAPVAEPIAASAATNSAEASAAAEPPVADPGEQVIAAAVTAVQAPQLAVAAEFAVQAVDSEAVAPADPDATAADPADADATSGDASTAAPPRAPRAGRPAAGKYMVQIKAFRAQIDADAFAESLRDKGYTVAVSAVEVADKGQFFRVRMGPFGTLDAARAAQRKLELAEGHATIILATP